MSTPQPLSMVTDDRTPSLDLEEDWGHRRGNIRHEVSLPAVIHDRVVGPIACVIEDISSTGMLIALELFMAEPGKEPLKAGASAELVFAPDPDGAPADKVKTPVEIMWRTPVAIGVRFLKIDETLRDGLRVVAKAAVEARAGRPDERREITLDQRRIILACRKTVEKLLPNIIWALRTEVTKRLRALADGANPQIAKQVREEADLIDEKANAIGRTIERRFLQGYAVASDLDQTQELTMAHLAGTFGGSKAGTKAAALLGNQTAERNARIVAVGHAAEERYKAKYFALNVRLANVIGHPLDQDTNPLVPANACRIMWEATVSHCDTPNVQRCLQHTLQNRVIPLLGELYESLDQTLDREGARRIFDMR